MVHRVLFIAFLLFLFIVETTWFQWLSPDVWGIDYTIVPALSLSVIIFIALFVGVGQGMGLALIFGLMYDLAFGRTIGIYVFSFVFIVYVVGALMKQLYKHDVAVYFAVIFGIGTHLLLLYGLNRLFDMTEMSWEWMFYHHFLPSLLANSVFVLLLIRPVKHWFHQMGVSVDP